MLTDCPECKLPVSDKALYCPHCGYPVKGPAKKRTRKKHEHRRLPNGFGRITKINRNLANPYRVMVTVGHDEYGKPIGKLLKPKAYFATYNDAYMALVEYNRKPYELDDDITVFELYTRWFSSVENNVTKSTINGYKMAWNYCSSTYDVKVREIRARHIRYCLDSGQFERYGTIKTPTPFVQARIKQLWNALLDYAMAYELIDKNPAKLVTLPKHTQSDFDADPKHICFAKGEMELLWQNIDEVPYVDLVLFQCYSGWRPRELGTILLENVDLDNWTIVGGSKTSAGKNRIVPIHTCVRHIVKNMCDVANSLGSEYLVNAVESSQYFMTYDKYHDRFMNVINKLNLDPRHRPHDPRKQFITMAKAAGMNDFAIKRIVGHTIKDITEKIYTERDPLWLAEEMEKLKGPVNDWMY